jgi:hypothetical protein
MARGISKNKSHWDGKDSQQRAQDALRKEVKAGRIVKPDNCQTCGSAGVVVGHHWRGYEFPFDVWWVCVSCNARLPDHDGSVSLSEAKSKMNSTKIKQWKSKKTDNHNPAAKLALRRYFLEKYHADNPPHVLDCCQGGGVMWNTLRNEYPVASYWGVDLKPKKGRLKLDSVRILSQKGWPQNVVDVDTYGSPWKHWVALLPNIHQPTTIFLTIGQWQMGTDSEIFRALGMGDLKIPPGIAVKLHGISLSYCLARGCDYCTIIEAMESVSNGSARYVGVHLVPKETPARESLPPKQAKQSKLVKGASHV